MPKTKTPRVAVLVQTSIDWGRRLIHGIARYAHKHGPWQLSIEARGGDEPVRLPPGWVGDGVIARVITHATIKHLETARIPFINVSSIQLKGVNLPQVTTDLSIWARLAAEHFFDRGLKHFGYVGLRPLSHVKHQRQMFDEVLAEKGYQCLSYKLGRGAGKSTGWQAQQEDIIRWLKELPKPVGVLAWPMKCGQQVVDACRYADILVPEQVAVLAGDEDGLLCSLCTPPLSAIMVHSERVGYEAAALLDRLMQGQRPPKEPILIEPTGVITRQSTDTLAIDDVELARAVRFIRDHTAEPIRVKDVLRAVPLSRSRLERGFQAVLGRTPNTEIRRVHLERAKQLLAQTDMPIPDVAAASGFASPEYLSYAFKSETGLTPHKYRSKVRTR